MDDRLRQARASYEKRSLPTCLKAYLPTLAIIYMDEVLAKEKKSERTGKPAASQQLYLLYQPLSSILT